MVDKTTYRDSIGRLGSPWTNGFWGSRFKYCAGVVLDACTDALRDGVKSRFPGYGTPEALPYLGNDRQIIRGFAEPDAVYARRISQAFSAWKHAGSAPALLRQLLAYVYPATPIIRIVSSTVDATSGDLITSWWSINAGVVTLQQVRPGNWNWDGQSDPEWSRFWVIMYPGAFAAGGHYGDGGLWSDGRSWGTTATPEQVGTLRRIIQQWKGSHSQAGATVDGGGLILAFDAGLFDPTDPPGAPLPDGTWNIPANRAADAAYLNGFT